MRHAKISESDLLEVATMKIRIVRLSSHQNAKVLAVMTASVSALIAIPLGIIFLFIPVPTQPGAPHPPPGWLFMLFPLLYLILGYLGARVWCAVYNLFAKLTGGLEFETSDQ
jgi:hypothetical protein